MANVRDIDWLPATCAYRLRAAGERLPDWHYLVCGDREAVHRAGQSVRGWTISEDDAGDLEHHMVDRELLRRDAGDPHRPPSTCSAGAAVARYHQRRGPTAGDRKSVV